MTHNYPYFRGRQWLFGAIVVSTLSGFVCGWMPQAKERVDGTISNDEKGAQSVDLGGVLQSHCHDCHHGANAPANLDLTDANLLQVEKHTHVWEKVLAKLRSAQMPPPDTSQLTKKESARVIESLERRLDRHARTHPNPGRTDTLRRLTRTEYANAIRDLLHLQIDAESLLPADELSHGFDNVTVGELSPALLNRYLSAAEQISRQALGRLSVSPEGRTIRLKADLTQEKHVPGLPLGTRGGAVFVHHFPHSGTYEFAIRLTRDRNEEIEGLRGVHTMELLLDKQSIRAFQVKRPPNKQYGLLDARLKTRAKVTAGTRQIGVTFRKKSFSLIETKRQPYESQFNMHRHPRQSPAVYQISIRGPLEPRHAGPGTAVGGLTGQIEREETESRRLIFKGTTNKTDAAAELILKRLMRRAYRRTPSNQDVEKTMRYYLLGRKKGGSFDDGIELALSSILVSPRFLFRVEADPPGLEAGQRYAVSDGELATRLAFFLWSSIPDDELLDLAAEKKLHLPEVLSGQVTRMLADERSQSLTSNFAAQWLYLRNLTTITPDQRKFPDFDENLRIAMRRETELFFDEVRTRNLNVVSLLRSDFTYLNERLAKHYGIKHVFGSRFRRVDLPSGSKRGGLLRQASILTVTSYATRTSPVVRGHWILKNLLGAEPPPPPANVPALKENTVNAKLSIRKRLAQHRADPACSSCHQLMDPIGFALENFDPVGRWRDYDDGKPIVVNGTLFNGQPFDGIEELEQLLIEAPEQFVATLTAKLLTFALGRGVDENDAPAVRSIIRNSSKDDYRFRTLIREIVQSEPFLHRMTK